MERESAGKVLAQTTRQKPNRSKIGGRASGTVSGMEFVCETQRDVGLKANLTGGKKERCLVPPFLQPISGNSKPHHDNLGNRLRLVSYTVRQANEDVGLCHDIEGAGRLRQRTSRSHVVQIQGVC